ncbi:DUF5689 domain-containing protein [Chitinophagaceae bacterium LWZ2-11]
MKNFILYTLLIVVLTNACNRKIDEPPTEQDGNITANVTIKELREMHAYNNIEAITDDKVIEGVVIADDRSGNFFKQITIQDATGGIIVKMDGYNLYTDYPIGKKIAIKLKGLFLGDYNRMMQIGGGKDNSNPSALVVTSIASTLFNKYIIKGSFNNVVKPKVITVDQLNDSYQSMLIQLEDFQFAATDTSKTYSDVSLSSSGRTFTLKSCAGSSIALRNSSYASFCGIKVPGGRGSINAIYSIFGISKQIYIRDTSDIHFTGKRCGPVTLTLANISDIRALFHNDPVIIDEGKKIKGIVISNKIGKNIAANEMIIQQAGSQSGIRINFTTEHNYNIGDEVEINISSLTLEEKEGMLQISNTPPANAVKISTGTIMARAMSIENLLINFKTLEGTLISLHNVSLSGGTSHQWTGTINISNNDGIIKHITLPAASFANTVYPYSNINSLTGIATTVNNEKVIMIRMPDDVDTTVIAPTNAGLIISEYIEGTSTNRYLELYNASSKAIDLSQYTVRLFLNGAIKAKSSVKLDTLLHTTTLSAYGIIVLKHPTAKLVLPAGVTAYTTDVCNFNGNDAVTLEKSGTLIDVFGQVGVNPGTSWTIAGNANGAVDKTVRRKPGIIEGNTNWTISAANEWLIFGKDDVSNLGMR